MAKQKVCGLSRNKSIAFLKQITNNKIFYKNGVWNPYKQKDREEAIKAIWNSPYGADIFKDVANGEIYVSVPCASDMW